MPGAFRVGMTRDFLREDGTIGWGDIGLGALDEAHDVTWEFLPEDGQELTAEQVSPYDALIVLAPRVAAPTVEGGDRLALIARFGVGYDNVDVEACTRNGVILTITPDGVRRPVAASILALLLALSHRLLDKDRIARSGRWDEKLDHMGTGLTGKTLGSSTRSTPGGASTLYACSWPQPAPPTSCRWCACPQPSTTSSRARSTPGLPA